ncbi:snapalysin family zinc-dependent metalloprotease [Streptomyces armeniacus]|uniref:Extracellular small neutral protease n=1 Tax=Streptomyces armeniacus TaxID=83291 RepID=A0A345XIH2_9ACTN|nr:snapalysin family zinc-dependent metalloprotease [Streptomyces armeniacus]AXK31438.1 snapalysin family zinc-dependent metalloprotease [Streptomyces armeniacus]
MLRKVRIGVLAGVATVALVAAPTAIATTSPAPAPPAPDRVAQTTLYYDDSQAQGWEEAVTAGVESWNSTVENVKLAPAEPGSRAEITIVATSGWPQATLGPVRPGGSARVELGQQAVDDGHDKIRIAAHELGHNLGLPDTKPGPCSQLMSGSSAGTSCKNALPDEREQASVEANYGNGAAGRTPSDGRTIVDAP